MNWFWAIAYMLTAVMMFSGIPRIIRRVESREMTASTATSVAFFSLFVGLLLARVGGMYIRAVL